MSSLGGDVDSILSSIRHGDTKTKILLLPRLQGGLKSGSIAFKDDRALVGSIVDTLLSCCLTDNNSNVIMVGLECIECMCDRASADVMSSYFTSVSQSMSSSLFSNSKLSIRKASIKVCLAMLPFAHNLGHFYEKLVVNNMKSKANWRVRSTALQLLIESLSCAEGGVGTQNKTSSSASSSSSLSSSSFKSPLHAKHGKTILSNAFDLLSDANQEVRAEAIEALISLYAVDPHPVRSYLHKVKSTIRQAIFKELSERFQEIDGDDARGHAHSDDNDNGNDGGGGGQHHHHQQQQQLLTGAGDSEGNRANVPPAPSAAARVSRKKAQAQSQSQSQSQSQYSHSNSATTDEVEPLQVYSERDLSSHLSDIAAHLNNTDSDFWTERMNALITLERLIAGQAHVNYKSAFLGGVKQLPIGRQIEDLRSQITSQACKTIVFLAENLGDSFSPFLELWLPSILHLTISGVRLMAQQGQNCLRHLMAVPSFGYHVRVLSFLLGRCTEKKCHPQERRGCVSALATAYRRWNTSVLEKINGPFTRVLKDVLQAKDPTVREEARFCYWSYESQFTKGAEKLFLELDSSTQKTLMKCRVACNEQWATFVNEGHRALTREFDSSEVAHPASSSSAVPKKATHGAASATSGPRRVVRKQQTSAAGASRVSKSSTTTSSSASVSAAQSHGHEATRDHDKSCQFSLESSLDQCGSKHWATREECFKSIAKNIDDIVASITPHTATRIAAALSGHIIDPHHRVSQAALEAALICITEQQLAQGEPGKDGGVPSRPASKRSKNGAASGEKYGRRK